MFFPLTNIAREGLMAINITSGHVVLQFLKHIIGQLCIKMQIFSVAELHFQNTGHFVNVIYALFI